MAKKSGKKKIVGLVCEESGHRHYYTIKSDKQSEPLRLRKYNPVLRKHTWYKETKKNLGRNTVNSK